MSWLTLIMQLVTIISIFMKRGEKAEIVSEALAIERAKVINEINRRLVEASRIPQEMVGLSDEELDSYVQDKGWFRQE